MNNNRILPWVLAGVLGTGCTVEALHDKDYKGTAARYGCSYSQVFDWVRKYQDKGEEGLQDKRGQRKPENELNETERLQRQVKILESKLKEAEMENELLKKLQEVEGRRYSPEGNSHRSS